MFLTYGFIVLLNPLMKLPNCLEIPALLRKPLPIFHGKPVLTIPVQTQLIQYILPEQNVLHRPPRFLWGI